MAKGRQRVLTPEQVKEIKTLKEKENLSNSLLASLYNVGRTTIWDNLHAEHRSFKRIRLIKKRVKYNRCSECGILYNTQVQEYNVSIGGLCTGCCILYFKKQNHTSKEISDFMKIGLDIVNKYWTL